jgi:hypothetical protein
MQHAVKVYSVVVDRLGLVQFEPDPSSIEKKLFVFFVPNRLQLTVFLRKFRTDIGLHDQNKVLFFKKKRST